MSYGLYLKHNLSMCDNTVACWLNSSVILLSLPVTFDMSKTI